MQDKIAKFLFNSTKSQYLDYRDNHPNWTKVPENQPFWWKTGQFTRHLKDTPKGITNAQDFFPFISIDVDRHDGTTSKKDHIANCLKIKELLELTDLTWIVQINPNNGSTTFYGFLLDVSGGFVEQSKKNALKRANLLAQAMKDNGLIFDQIFPICPSSMFPLRYDKITIGSGGQIKKTIGKRQVGKKQVVWQNLTRDQKMRWQGDIEKLEKLALSGDKKPKKYTLEKCEYYDCLDFVSQIRNGNFCKNTFIKILNESCKNLPDVSVSKTASLHIDHDDAMHHHDLVAVTALTANECLLRLTSLQKQQAFDQWQRGELSAFARDRFLTQFLFRCAGGKPNLDQAMQIKESLGLYTDHFDEKKVKARLNDIIPYVAKTFKRKQTAKLSITKEIRQLIQKNISYTVQTGLKFDETGIPVKVTSTKTVKKEQARQIATAIVDCIKYNNEVSTNFVEYTMKQNFGWFDFYKFQTVRNWLEQNNIIDIYDKQHEQNKCWRYRFVTRTKRTTGFSYPKNSLYSLSISSLLESDTEKSPSIIIKEPKPPD